MRLIKLYTKPYDKRSLKGFLDMENAFFFLHLCTSLLWDSHVLEGEKCAKKEDDVGIYRG